MLKLDSRADFERLVAEGLEESLVLDYKASRALSRESAAIAELCKDVSAFANSAGGQIIYGIEEDKSTKRPSRVDDGVTDEKLTREWIEQILNSRIQPRLDGVRIDRIALSSDGFGYAVTIPATQRGPHQAPDQRYYKRFELQSVPMHDYEIRDVMKRAVGPEPFVDLTFGGGSKETKLKCEPGHEISRAVPIYVTISNRAAQPAMYCQVTIGIEADIELASQGTYELVTPPKDRAFELLRQGWSIEDRKFPIFKEASFQLAKVPFAIAVHSRYLESTRFEMFVEILSPGFQSAETWYLSCTKAILKILPSLPREVHQL